MVIVVHIWFLIMLMESIRRDIIIISVVGDNIREREVMSREVAI